MTKLWLDDERKAPEGFMQIKTVPQLINQLKKDEVVDCVSLDNDLGVNMLEGYHAIVQYLMTISNDHPIAQVKCWDIHTGNIVAADKMQALLDAGVKHGLLPQDSIITHHYAGQGYDHESK